MTAILTKEGFLAVKDFLAHVTDVTMTHFRGIK